MVRSFFLLPLLSIFTFCSTNKAEIKEPVKSDSIKTTLKVKPDSIILTDGLEMWSNIEQVDFCVPVPSKEYINDEKGEYERAKFVFVNKKNKKLQIVLQGMFRSDSKVSIEEYFKNSYPSENKMEGKFIEYKTLLKKNNCFYVKGFYTVTKSTIRFIEITWLRKDDAVSLDVSYDIKDTSIWNSRLKQIIASDSYCK